MAAPSGETKRGAAIDWRLKAKNLHRGSPETGVSKHQLQRSPIRFKGRADPSHIYLNSDRGRHTHIAAGAGDDEETPPGMQRITLSFSEGDEGPQYS